MRIGIYGGTFNPVHNGHINILKGFYDKLSLDKLLVIPTKIPPHKAAVSLAASEDRLAMLELALKNETMNFCVSDIELKSEGKSYTYLTINALKEIYPYDELYLLMGEDMFMIIDKWVNSEFIMKNSVICASVRSDDGEQRMKSFAESLSKQRDYFRYRIVDIPFIDVSSTEIRENIGSPDVLSGLVPKEVADYIIQNKLYC